MNTHLQSNNMFDNSDISTKQLHLMKDECPFERCIFVGDLNNNQSYQHIGAGKIILFEHGGKDDILDYILPWNYDDYIQVRSTGVPVLIYLMFRIIILCGVNFKIYARV